ncbi:hypothetical protein FKM82_022535 [Ascaphus truei]
MWIEHHRTPVVAGSRPDWLSQYNMISSTMAPRHCQAGSSFHIRLKAHTCDCLGLLHTFPMTHFLVCPLAHVGLSSVPSPGHLSNPHDPLFWW